MRSKPKRKIKKRSKPENKIKKVRKNKKSEKVFFAVIFLFLANRLLLPYVRNVDWLVYFIIIFVTLFVFILKEKFSFKNFTKEYTKIFSSFFFFPMIFLLYLSFNLINSEYSKSSTIEVYNCEIYNVFSGRVGHSKKVTINYKGNYILLENSSRLISDMITNVEDPKNYFVKLEVRKGFFNSFYTNHTIIHK